MLIKLRRKKRVIIILREIKKKRVNEKEIDISLTRRVFEIKDIKRLKIEKKELR